MSIRLYGEKAMNKVIAHLPEVKHAVHEKAKEGRAATQANLEETRGTTRWFKIFGPGHLTSTDVSQGEVDSFFSLIAPNAMAIEFGHEPSGVFAGTQTKSPEGLYILHRAAASLEV